MIRPLIILASILWCTTTWANDFLSDKLALISQVAKAVQLSQNASDSSSSSDDSSSSDSSSSDSSSSDASASTTAADTSSTAATTTSAAAAGTSTTKNRQVIQFAEPVLTLDINVEKEYLNSPQVRKLFRLLGIKKSYSVLYFVDNKALGRFNLDDNIVSVQTRSFVNMMDYLSNAVQVPVEAYEQGLVLSPKYPNGEFFDVTEITRGILDIRISKERPRCDANVQIYYRNHWFYIADTDARSKRTFSLVQQIFNFLSGTTKNNLTNPIITIPVR